MIDELKDMAERYLKIGSESACVIIWHYFVTIFVYELCKELKQMMNKDNQADEMPLNHICFYILKYSYNFRL